ncbi:type IV pilus modification PilV family protein [Sutcliffiella rhizosphaerae]|uniref:Prepilin-type N-terminal cleavage/methylation domain-containing protein n=1 Tax=Sutcliffiella rhizosphaerae TaxID=2880967 RepID=A0ABN8A2W5_9BACI|nr:type II secretion system protein [Sutcliffiella rhizosphaerae]CAG9619494.1 hypothetical protein BACCIP111883_00261 [Sutcliffiella rhizosphaerae]
MRTIHNNCNQKGLTLIEILVSIVILGIIFTGMLGFFSQMTTYSSHADNRITSMNLAEKVLNEYKSTGSYPTEEHIINGKSYYPKVTELSAHQSLDLISLHVEIYSDPTHSTSSLLTELYGYKEGN